MKSNQIYSAGWPDEDDGSNRTALGEILGLRGTWPRGIIELLRSNDPIHPAVRWALAAAIEGTQTTGVSLILKGHRHIHSLETGINSRHKQFEVGEWIEGEIQAGHTYYDTIEAAADNFLKGQKWCEAAHTYFRKTSQWIEEVQVPGTYYGRFTRSELVSKRCHDDAVGTPSMPNRDAAEYDAELTACLEEILEAYERQMASPNPPKAE